MAISAKSSVARIRVDEEPNGAYCTDRTGTLGNFRDVPCVRASVRYETRKDMIDPGMYGQTFGHRNQKITGVKRAIVTMVVPLATHTTKPGAGSTVAAGALGRLLKIALGGESLGIARAVTAGATTTTVPVTSITGLPVGNAIAYPTGAGSRYEVRTIKDNASSILSFKHALSAAPGNGVVGYPSATYYLGGTFGDQTTYLQCIYEGLNNKDRFVFFGGWCSSFEIQNIGPASPPGSVPQIAFEWTFARWLPVESVAGSANLTGALGRASYTNNVQLPVKDSEFRFRQNASTLIGALIKAPVISIQPSIAYVTHEAPNGIETIVQPIRVPPDDAVPVRINLVEPLNHSDDYWRVAFDADTNQYGFWHQLGSTSLGQGMIEVASAQVVAVGDEPGAITSVKVDAEGGDDADTVIAGLTGTSLDLALSPLRIHLC